MTDSVITFMMLRKMTEMCPNILFFLTIPNNTWQSATFPYINVQCTREGHKKSDTEICLPNQHSIDKCFSFNKFILVFPVTTFPPILYTVAPFSLCKPYTTHNSLIFSDKEPMLETSAFLSPCMVASLHY